MSYPVIPLSNLPPNTVVPVDEVLFIQYLNRLYEDIAFAVNNRDYGFFPISITSTPQNIPNIPNFGAFILCVSGGDTITTGPVVTGDTLPTITVSLCKSASTASGQVVTLGSQVGTGTWAGNSILITSTSTNFQIAHDNTGVAANFNIRILSTQSQIQGLSS
jgi:hypothetical protein